MEAQVLDRHIEWEARRAAASFGVAEYQWHSGEDEDGHKRYCMRGMGYHRLRITWAIEHASGKWCFVQVVGRDGKWSVVAPAKTPPGWFTPSSAELMARGLYCLGFEDKEVLARLNLPFSSHEKMELKQLMPREFWPQKWTKSA